MTMQITDVQRILAKAEVYKDSIDGIIGQNTKEAILFILTPELKSKPWDWDRRAFAAAQIVLKHDGFLPKTAAIDGLVGNLTNGALLEWNHKTTYGKNLVLAQTPLPGYAPTKTRFPRQQDCNEFYGEPGPEVATQLTTVHLPMPFRIDYDLEKVANTMQLHEKCAESARDALIAIYKQYGSSKLQLLGLDRYAGAYNHRRMRGGSSWSMHAYGCAIDFYAGRNGLTTRCPNALFCKPAYYDFFDIWESYGWVSLGRAIGRDWMHVQAARL